MNRAAVATVVTSCLVFLAAACGGSSGSHVAQQSGAIGFAGCMRSHRVPNWPDPSSSGVFDKSKLTPQKLGATGSQVSAAERACQHLLPNGGRPPSRSRRQQVRAQALSFSQCVRAHGVPDFPDPDSTGRIPDPASIHIDQGSPRFEAANQACGRYRPPYMPSNADYDAWARTHRS
jgi:hypothetical protein